MLIIICLLMINVVLAQQSLSRVCRMAASAQKATLLVLFEFWQGKRAAPGKRLRHGFKSALAQRTLGPPRKVYGDVELD